VSRVRGILLNWRYYEVWLNTMQRNNESVYSLSSGNQHFVSFFSFYSITNVNICKQKRNFFCQYVSVEKLEFSYLVLKKITHTHTHHLKIVKRHLEEIRQNLFWMV